MAKIDLLSRKWCNLVFEGRNTEYGAYLLRKESGQRHARAMGLLLLLLALCALPLLFLWLDKGEVDGKRAMESIANLSKLDQAQLEQNHELKAVATALQPRLQELKEAIRFAPEIEETGTAELIVGRDDLPDAEVLKLLNLKDSLQEDEVQLKVSEDFPNPIEVVEVMPQFPGGLGALMMWLEQHIHYPALCVHDKVEGEVQVSFIVNKDGRISDAKIVKKVHPLLDKEALLAVRSMPAWEPGRVDGRVSLVRVTIPVAFALR